MIIEFYKYQGTGNDFVLLDNRSGNYNHLQQHQIALLCNRHFGIGADGLMLLQQRAGYDFEMVYFNADGAVGSMCGNGGRCLVQFAHDLGYVGEQVHFLATDGAHDAVVRQDGWVELRMIDVDAINNNPAFAILNTGSPHYVQWCSQVAAIPVVEAGSAIRYSAPYAEDGININFAEKQADYIFVRTYERGVEDETLSCGTGVTAVALAAADDVTGTFEQSIRTKGGPLTVRFTRNSNGSFTNIWLCGPAKQVYAGKIDITRISKPQ